MDRADIKLFIGPPTRKAIYTILQSCLEELMRVGIIDDSVNWMDANLAAMYYDCGSGADGDDMRSLSLSQQQQQQQPNSIMTANTTTTTTTITMNPTTTNDPNQMLWEIAGQCQGMSGRSLRKLAFLAHASFLRRRRCALGEFLVAMKYAAAQQQLEKQAMSTNGRRRRRESSSPFNATANATTTMKSANATAVMTQQGIK